MNSFLLLPAREYWHLVQSQETTCSAFISNVLKTRNNGVVKFLDKIKSVDPLIHLALQRSLSFNKLDYGWVFCIASSNFF